MRYKIINRIQDGKVTVGYSLTDENNKLINATKDEAIQMASKSLIVNAVYNKKTKSLSGANGVDLRSIPVVQYDASKRKNINNMSNIFKGINSIEGLDVDSLHTSNVKRRKKNN